MSRISISKEQTRQKITQIFRQIKVTNIHLQQHRVDPELIQYLCLCNINNLSHVNLNRNKIGDKGMEILTKFHLQWKKLSVLGIIDNQITFKGMEIFGSQQWNKLAAIYLNQNHIGDKGVKYLSRCLTTNLEELCLDRCDLHNKSIKYLSKAHLSNVRKLSLSFNKLSKGGMKYFPQCSFNLLKVFFLTDQLEREGKFATKDLLHMNCSKIQSFLLFMNILEEMFHRDSKIFYSTFKNLSTLNEHNLYNK